VCVCVCVCVCCKRKRETKVSSRLDTINIINPVFTLDEPPGNTHTHTHNTRTHYFFFPFECGKRDHEAQAAHTANKSQRISNVPRLLIPPILQVQCRATFRTNQNLAESDEWKRVSCSKH
jgi:hypothetical protein